MCKKFDMVVQLKSFTKMFDIKSSIKSYTNGTVSFKNVNNCLNTNIYSYLETSGACIIKLITAVIYSLRNKLECLSLASLSSLVQCLRTNTLAYYRNRKYRPLMVKALLYSKMLLIFLTPVLIRHLWLLKTVAFLHWCLIPAVLLKMSE